MSYRHSPLHPTEAFFALANMITRRHIFGDLRPYICLSEDCPALQKDFARRREWMEHETQNHWKIFPCPYSCGQTFHSAVECGAHLQKTHPTSMPISQQNAMILLSARPLKTEDGIACPLCHEVLTSRNSYQRHVGHHQEQLALFALPQLERGDEETSDDGNEEESISEVESYFVKAEIAAPGTLGFGDDNTEGTLSFATGRIQGRIDRLAPSKTSLDPTESTQMQREPENDGMSAPPTADVDPELFADKLKQSEETEEDRHRDDLDMRIKRLEELVSQLTSSEVAERATEKTKTADLAETEVPMPHGQSTASIDLLQKQAADLFKVNIPRCATRRVDVTITMLSCIAEHEAEIQTNKETKFIAVSPQINEDARASNGPQ
jgi:uncharacterized C2H2 Zn-finger protein